MKLLVYNIKKKKRNFIIEYDIFIRKKLNLFIKNIFF